MLREKKVYNKYINGKDKYVDYSSFSAYIYRIGS
jgi:hypothetical protein